MLCNCQTYICVDANYNPCLDTMALTGILANQTGEWTGRVYFNGTSRSFAISVTNGQEISLPTSQFNENYTHHLVLFNTEDTQVACYKVTTRLDFTPIEDEEE